MFYTNMAIIYDLFGHHLFTQKEHCFNNYNPDYVHFINVYVFACFDYKCIKMHNDLKHSMKVYISTNLL